MLTRVWTRHASRLAVGFVSVAFAAGGCGGGGDEGQGGQGGGNGGATETKAKAKPKEATVITDFKVAVLSPQQARITATLERPAALDLRVRRQAGDNNTKVGNVGFGRRPQGPVSINWNLRVAGKQLTPGTYQLVMRGDPAGRSERIEITVPG
jgi:hypothetical protein